MSSRTLAIGGKKKLGIHRKDIDQYCCKTQKTVTSARPNMRDINERYQSVIQENIDIDKPIHKIKISRRGGLARRLIFGPEAQGGREGTAAKIHTSTTLTRKMMSALQNLGVFAELILGP
jgi:hypothetical protein